MSAIKNLAPAWKPGTSGNPGGRPKRILPRVDEVLKREGKEPIKELLALMPSLKPREQMQLWLELLPYIHAKPKPMDEGEEDDLSKLSTEELVKLVQEKLPEIGKAG